MPEHPWELVRAGIAGSVDIRIAVEANGRVKSVAIIGSSMKEFEAPTLAAVQSWRFLVFRPPGKSEEEVATLACKIQFAFDES